MRMGASENDRTSAVRDTAAGSKNRAIYGAITVLFREAARSVAHRSVELHHSDRRRGETEGDFKRTMRCFSRRFDVRASFRARSCIAARPCNLPKDALVFVQRCEGETWDQASEWHHDDWNCGQEIDFDASAPHDYGAPEI